MDPETAEEVILRLTRRVAELEKTLGAIYLPEVPDGYAVVTDSKLAPRGFWFVGVYHDRVVAEKVMLRSPQAKGERIKRIFFHPED